MNRYDLICSLGGNCSVAHNLLYRGLRKFALPFDWTYFEDISAIYKLAESFEVKFADQLKKENLVELPVNTAHPDKIQYLDLATNIIWANHFTSNDLCEYESVKKKIDRRFKRLLDCIGKSNSILFIFALNKEIEIKPFKYLYQKLAKLYPSKNINIKIIAFNCDSDLIINSDNIELLKFKRGQNLYDFSQTNYEWSFLDNLELTNNIINESKFKLFKILFIKRGVKINIFPIIRTTVFSVKLYLFGLKFNFTLGKERN